jgi:DNA recombination protein RmuC
MTTIVYVILALLAGGIIAWLLTGYSLRASFSGHQAALEGRVKSAEAVVGELRQQLQQKEHELGRVRRELDSERQLKIEALTRLETSLKSFEEQKALIDTMKKEMTDTFNALSSAALKSSSEDFLRLASEHLGKVVSETKGKLGEHKTAMDGLLRPLMDALRKYEEQIQTIEVKRKQDYTSLDEQIKILATTHRELQKETGNLVSALRKPHIRGRWGEVTLRNVVELAGMSSHCDFTEQVSIDTESGRLRPDMVIHLPGGHDIIVDSKVSMEALLEVVSAPTEEKRRESMKRHAAHVKEQIGRLSSKAYWNQFSQSPELAVLFLGESSLVSALEVEPTLMEDSMAKRVLIATPTTLFALLTAVAYGWRQEQVTKNAELIASLGKEIYERFAVWSRHFGDISTALGKAVDAYNRAAGSIESRILPSVRKFKELGATGAEEITLLKQIDLTPKNLNFSEPDADKG